jgi:hypothetical protein
MMTGMGALGFWGGALQVTVMVAVVSLGMLEKISYPPKFRPVTLTLQLKAPAGLAQASRQTITAILARLRKLI